MTTSDEYERQQLWRRLRRPRLILWFGDGFILDDALREDLPRLGEHLLAIYSETRDVSAETILKEVVASGGRPPLRITAERDVELLQARDLPVVYLNGTEEEQLHPSIRQRRQTSLLATLARLADEEPVLVFLGCEASPDALLPTLLANLGHDDPTCPVVVLGDLSTEAIEAALATAGAGAVRPIRAWQHWAEFRRDAERQGFLVLVGDEPLQVLVSRQRILLSAGPADSITAFS